MSSDKLSHEVWPSLPLEAWRDTYATLHMMTQVVGKVRLATAPMINHWWQVPLYATPRGLSTSTMPHGTRTFEIGFDFVEHVLRIDVDDGGSRVLPLRARPVADFYREVMNALEGLGVPVEIWTTPAEVEAPIPFEKDYQHVAYDRDAAYRCWRVLAQSTRVLADFRSGFVGKCSPVHFFWGGFDLAVTRFSGRRAPQHPGGIPGMPDRVAREAYSRECSSVGFWPGGGALQYPAFYAYTYPEPPGFREFAVRPAEAFYSDDMREFILPYDAVRQADDPDRMLLEFCQSTYEAGAIHGAWDRAELEQSYPRGRALPGRGDEDGD